MLLSTFIYVYVKICDTGSFAYGAWLEGSKIDEGAERLPEKGRTFIGFFLLGQETETFAMFIE